jgi:signal transduction histidine kinase
MPASKPPTSRLAPYNWSIATRLTVAALIFFVITISVGRSLAIRTIQNNLVQQVGANFTAQATSLNNLTSLFLLEKVSQLQVLAESEQLQDTITNRNTVYTGNDAAIKEQLLALNQQWLAAAGQDPLVANVTTTDLDRNPTTHQLAAFFQEFPTHQELLITDRYGATIAAIGRPTDYYQAEQDWWQAAYNGGQGAVYLASPQFDESAQLTTLLISLPIRAQQSGEVIGILRSNLDVTELYDVLAAFVFGQTGNTFLLAPSGATIFENVQQGQSEKEELTGELRQRLVSEPTGYLRATGSDGHESIFGHATLDTASFQNRASHVERETITALAQLGWVTVVHQESFEALGSLDTIRQASQIVGVTIVTLAAILAHFLSRFITAPLAQLNQAAQKIGAGQLDVALSSSVGGEIGQLTETFNQMAVRLRETLTALTKRTEELERSNAELEQFAYVASHDLKAPLRAIASLSGWIEEDIQESLTDETRQQMTLLRGRVHRMENLIDGILQYSRAARVVQTPEKVQVNQLLAEVKDTLAPANGFVIEIEPGMPTVTAERVKLQQVFMNLLSNAIKHHHRPDGRIKVSSRPLPNDLHEFAVSDDGPGIAPLYHQKVFQIFQTLRPRDEVESTGVGLAVVKKIVEEQGGTIRLESEEGKGATFYFTWPDKPNGK